MLFNKANLSRSVSGRLFILHAMKNNTQYSDLKAVYLNCTLKRSPEKSHTKQLMQVSMDIMRQQGVTINYFRVVNHKIAPGVYPDMKEHGWSDDEWPKIAEAVLEADIVVIGTPIWLGEKSSECTKIIERLYGHSGERNSKGQSIFYGKAGGCIITGNEDGIKHCAMSILYALQHVGYAIPPQADAGWIGEAGPGPSYGDDGVGLDNEFTQRNTTFMTWNLLHFARMMKDKNGIPDYGNNRDAWDNGANFDHPNPEYR